MKDEKGVYYHPEPGNSAVRAYVRKGPDGEVEFRLWRKDFPEVWERHPWLSYNVIKDAAALYREERDASADPLRLYDISVARAILRGETF